jgi:hypothetical protein
MAEALARGFASKKISSVDKMFCTDVSKARKEVFEEVKGNGLQSSTQRHRQGPGDRMAGRANFLSRHTKIPARGISMLMACLSMYMNQIWVG